MGDEGIYRLLVRSAILIGIFVGAILLYQTLVVGRPPGDTAYLEGEQFFDDGQYARALDRYDEALALTPGHYHARRARARTLMQLGRHAEALSAYDVLAEARPDFAPLYANRGILQDRMGSYSRAIADYEKALALDPSLGDGPHWLTRFLRNQPQRPPGIAERAAYLRAELAKPESERLLRVPELDAAQRSYKQ